MNDLFVPLKWLVVAGIAAFVFIMLCVAIGIPSLGWAYPAPLIATFWWGMSREIT